MLSVRAMRAKMKKPPHPTNNHFGRFWVISPEEINRIIREVREGFSEPTAELLLLGFRGPIDDYSAAIKLEPDNAYAYTSRARCYELTAEYDTAISDLSEAIRLDPDDPTVHHRRYHALVLKLCSRTRMSESERKELEDKCFADYAKAMELGYGE